MAAHRSLDPDLSVDDVMRFWPDTVGVFIKHGTLCIGCPVGSFHTIVDACREHSLDEGAFRRDLLLAIGKQREGRR